MVSLFNNCYRDQLNLLTSQTFIDHSNYYYNFTTESKVQNISQTVRKYERFEFGDAFVACGQAFTKVHISGLSFMYN